MTNISHKIIDPHLHLFNLQQGDYAWIKPINPPEWPDKHLINKSFLESELVIAPPNQLAGFVHIEAGFDNQQPWREIDWLEEHCTLPFKSVAFADITATTFSQHINQLKRRRSVVGIRYILDEQAEEVLSSSLIRHHFELLAQTKLSFDAQLSLSDNSAIQHLVHLANTFKTVRIIINHAGWPPANNDAHGRQRWLQNLQILAKCANIAIKLSGWEMSNRAWQPQQASAVLQECITTLGNTRVMLASNFPLCLFSMSYTKLWNTYTDLPDVSPQCFDKIIFSNAAHWYNVLNFE